MQSPSFVNIAFVSTTVVPPLRTCSKGDACAPTTDKPQARINHRTNAFIQLLSFIRFLFTPYLKLFCVREEVGSLTQWDRLGLVERADPTRHETL